jgi:hypothetical protein
VDGCATCRTTLDRLLADVYRVVHINLPRRASARGRLRIP